MASGAQESFPKGSVAFGSGDWNHCTNAKIDYTNGASMVNTFGGSGITTGPRTATASFEVAIGTLGQDVDTLKKIKEGTVVQVRFRFPVARVMTITGVLDKSSFDFSVDKQISESLSMIGTIDFI